jgi:hypothetical protein
MAHTDTRQQTMFTIKHEIKATGTTKVLACSSYEKLPVNDLGKRIPQLVLQDGNTSSKMLLDYGDVVYVENIKGRTIDVIRAPRN